MKYDYILLDNNIFWNKSKFTDHFFNYNIAIIIRQNNNTNNVIENATVFIVHPWN